MNTKFLILAAVLIICAFVHETSAQYAYNGYGYPAYGGYYGDGTYTTDAYGYATAYPTATPFTYYGKRSAGFQSNR